MDATRRHAVLPTRCRPRRPELTVRFVSHAREVRHVKDAITRDLLAGLDQAGIVIASATSEIVGLPTVHVEGKLS